MSNALFVKVLDEEATIKKVLKVKPWNGNTRFDIREWNSGYPTRKGVSLPTLRWVSLTYATRFIDEALADLSKNREVKFEYHIGGNVYVTVDSPYRLVDIRQRFVDEEGVLRPTRRGVKLRLKEWASLKEAVEAVKVVVPETAVLVPCSLQEDHSNQRGFLTCPECNPTGFLEA